MILECYEHGEKIKNALEIIEKMIELEDDYLEQDVTCSSEKIGVLE